MRVFVTGAAGHIASALIPELIEEGHSVTGLVRSDEAEETVAAYGAVAVRGDVADLDLIQRLSVQSDGVVHLALVDRRQMRSGNMADAAQSQREVVRALGDALAGTNRPLVTASAIGALGALGRPSTEADAAGHGFSEEEVISLASRGVRSSIVRLPPITHSILDRNGFAPTLIGIARRTGVAGFVGDGANRWPAVHTLDAAHLFRLALENADPGTRWHAVSDEGVPIRDIAQSIADHLDIRSASVPDDQLQEHFGFLAALIGLDLPSTSLVTGEKLGWLPEHPGLLADLAADFYFTTPTA